MELPKKLVRQRANPQGNGAADKQDWLKWRNVLQPGGRAANQIDVRRVGRKLSDLLIGNEFAVRDKDRRGDDGASQRCLSLMPAERAMIAGNIVLDRCFRRWSWVRVLANVMRAGMRVLVTAMRMGGG